jgi:hypothetical protein
MLMMEGSPHRSELAAALARIETLSSAPGSCEECAERRARRRRRRLHALSMTRGLATALGIVLSTLVAALAAAVTVYTGFFAVLGALGMWIPALGGITVVLGWLALRALARRTWGEDDRRWVACAGAVVAVVAIAPLALLLAWAAVLSGVSYGFP